MLSNVVLCVKCVKSYIIAIRKQNNITREKYNTSHLKQTDRQTDKPISVRNRTKDVKDRTTQVHTYITKQRLSYLLIFFTNEHRR